MNQSSTLTNNVAGWRILALVIAIGLVFIIFIIQLFNLQILQGNRKIVKMKKNYKKILLY